MLTRDKMFTYQMTLVFFYNMALATAVYYYDNVNLTMPNNTQFVSLYGPDIYHYFGYAVSAVGDINDDGVDDIILGARSITTSVKGSAYLIYGSKDGISNFNLNNSLTSTQGFQIQGEAVGDFLGCGASTAGDFNGDGIADIILGAPYMSPNGAAYVIFGTKTPITDFDLSTDLVGRGFKISGTQSQGIFGAVVTNAGDVNGDGLSDVIISAYVENFNGANSGTVYVIFGRRTDIIDITVPNDLTSDRGFYIRGKPNARLGISMSAAGDVNDDGVDDLIIGTLNGATVGEAYIIYGRKTGFINYILSSTYSTNEVARISGITINYSFGATVSKARDINGDGIDDILIGASLFGTPGKIQTGAVYVIFGQKNNSLNMNMATEFDNSKGFVIYGAAQFDMLGATVSDGGDFNGDGMNDIFIAGTSASTPQQTSCGVAYVIYGRQANNSNINISVLEKTEGFKIQGTNASSLLGYALNSAGDVNGDGGKDLIVTAIMEYNPVGLKTGVVFILFGVPAPIQIQEPEPVPIETIVQVQSAGVLANQAAAVVLFFGTINNALPLLFTFLVDILFYVRYLKILYPPRLSYMLEQPDPQYISISYITSAPEQLVEFLPSYNIPEKFEFYGFYSSFLINFWRSIMTFLIVLVIIILALLLEYATRSKKWLNDKFIKLKQSMKWNYLIAMFTGYFSDIALNTFLETRTVKFRSFVEGLSFMTCLFMNFLAVFMLIQMFRVIKKLRVAQEEVRVKKTKTLEYLEKLKERFTDFEVIFNTYKDDSFLQQSYLLLFNLRLYLFYVIVAYLFDHPIVQTSMISVMGLLVLIYVAVKRPFLDKKDLVMSLIQEFILEIVNISAFVLAVTDDGQNATDRVRVIFGDLIIGCNIAFVFVGLIYTIVMLTLMFGDFYKYIKKKLTEKKQKKELSIHDIKVKTNRDIVHSANSGHDIIPIDDTQHALNASSFIDQSNSSQMVDFHLSEVTPKDGNMHSLQKPLEKLNRPRLGLHYQAKIALLHPRPIQIDQTRAIGLEIGQNLQASSPSPDASVLQKASNSTEQLEYISNLDISNDSQLTNPIKPKNTSLHYRREKVLRKF